jgi:hypothetical protein
MDTDIDAKRKKIARIVKKARVKEKWAPLKSLNTRTRWALGSYRRCRARQNVLGDKGEQEKHGERGHPIDRALPLSFSEIYPEHDLPSDAPAPRWGT